MFYDPNQRLRNRSNTNFPMCSENAFAFCNKNKQTEKAKKKERRETVNLAIFVGDTTCAEKHILIQPHAWSTHVSCFHRVYCFALLLSINNCLSKNKIFSTIKGLKYLSVSDACTSQMAKWLSHLQDFFLHTIAQQDETSFRANFILSHRHRNKTLPCRSLTSSS